MKITVLVSGVLSFALFLPAAFGECQPVRRALLVGINTYEGSRKPVLVEKPLVSRLPVGGKFEPREFWNLEGSSNDANDFAALLQGEPYSFDKDNIQVLLEEQATAQNILDTFQRRLIDQSTCPGDISVFFYSGHGSQIRNTSVKDPDSPDSYDETLVPYDAPDGVPDIRSKELVRLYLQAARKGIYLTVIADSCQSGGLSRGASDFSRSKFGMPDSRTVRDPGERDDSGNPLRPTHHSTAYAHAVLLLSAAYEKEAARENSANRKNGSFTAAMLDKLRNHPQHEAIGTLFEDVKLSVSLEHNDQHPQIDGEGRLDLDLLGQPANSTTGMIARVLRIQPDGSFLIDKGTAAGVYQNCELVSAMPDAPPVRLKVTEAHLADSIAQGDAGKGAVRPLWRFRLDKWVVPRESALRIFFAKDGPARKELMRAAATVGQLASAGVEVVADPTITNPSHQIWWLNKEWQLLSNVPGKGKSLGKVLELAQLRSLIPSGSHLFVNYPLPTKEASGLDLGEGTDNDAVTLQTKPDAPQYVLAGRWNGKGLEYAWLRPGVTVADQMGLNLPVSSPWFPLTDAALEDNLRSTVLKINRIYGWLTLAVPGGSGAGSFPYRLELRKAGTTEVLKQGRDHTTEGELYKFWLAASPADIAAITKDGAIDQRWIYIVGIDCNGKVDLLLPRGNANLGNHLPAKDAAPTEIELTAKTWDFRPKFPFGPDTYILLTSGSPLNPSLFPADAVRSESLSRGLENPLERLLTSVGSTRGFDPNDGVPADWSIQKVTLPSVAKKK